jgi:hypothetical protein
MNKVHAEIEYQKPDGTRVHSDICPPKCSSDNLNYISKRMDFSYQKFLHDCLDEWLNESNGTGIFYIKDEKYSLLDKKNQWLLCTEDQIIWIIGKRADNRFIANETTKNPIKIELN